MIIPIPIHYKAACDGQFLSFKARLLSGARWELKPFLEAEGYEDLEVLRDLLQRYPPPFGTEIVRVVTDATTV